MSRALNRLSHNIYKNLSEIGIIMDIANVTVGEYRLIELNNLPKVS